jgi:hypothetical protein
VALAASAASGAGTRSVSGTRRSTPSLTASNAGSVVRSRGSMPIRASTSRSTPGGPQLAQRLGRRSGQAGLRPGAARQAEHGELVGLEGDVGQGVLALVDAVAGLVLVQRVDVLGDQRDAELAQLVLVALEHPLEGLGRRRLAVLRHELADLGLGQGAPCVEEHEHEVQESLGLHLRRRRGARAGLAAHPPNATRRIRCRP